MRLLQKSSGKAIVVLMTLLDAAAISVRYFFANRFVLSLMVNVNTLSPGSLPEEALSLALWLLEFFLFSGNGEGMLEESAERERLRRSMEDLLSALHEAR